MYMKNETCIHKNAQYFYDHLKKIYMEKSEPKAFIPDISALKCNG